ncbi:16S rRNA (adenine(1408)-N(1))-methyltransferase [Jatrophihabitans endophyticus]|uniref:16S rRNA (Adenine(1408)-N(1))-methyltransferase n=1 Tax=Jatrophihabitans endophyticus TaxID=1206085 RepID=A0A1M5HIU3_9ACTN|nr:class I SAM-dependent methyltransferase [Jatrophihabitans endophyticus]SHG15889.1 16S rRNA (adenine(1408)-N(1))-methyltransferase [Jatrophihabitans endophyticus]
MRQVIGKATRDLDAAAFAALREPYRELVVDLGTGDGKHVLAVARSRPDALVVGLDAGPDAMRRTAHRAAARPAKGGVPNAVFVWAAVEQLPGELHAVDEVHCLMPWGSLLRALVTPEPVVLRGVAASCRPGAPFLVTLNLHAWRPPVADVGGTPEPTPASVDDVLAPGYAAAGWMLSAADYLDDAQLTGLGTSWTKRLGSTREELAVLGLRGTIGQDGN